MIWTAEYYPEAKKDVRKLDGSQQKIVKKAIEKIANNPLSIYEGGYGKPLGNKNGLDLRGLYKVKLKKLGLRIIYELVKENNVYKIVVVGLRADNEVYEIAAQRKAKYSINK